MRTYIGLGKQTLGGHKQNLVCTRTQEEVAIIFITSTIIWLQINNREGTQLHPSTENWVKDFLSMAQPMRTRTSFPLSQSLPSGSINKPPILLYQGADRLKTTITELINLLAWITPLSNSMKLEPIHVGPSKMDGSWWRVLTKHSPQEKGMAKHFSILALRTPWIVWKGKKIGQWKVNSPGW